MLTENSCIPNSAVVRVQDAAKMDISSGVKVLVGELWVSGIKKPDGVYRASNFPERITGKGRMLVGITGIGMLIMVK